jgi:hypothetical protein
MIKFNKIDFAEFHFVPVRALTSLRATPFVAERLFGADSRLFFCLTTNILRLAGSWF